jgi:sec-independent protein translocase protein TatC
MSFMEHINELRARLRVVAFAVLIILVFVIFFPSDPVYQVHHLGQYLNLQFLQHTVIASFVLTVRDYILPANWTLTAAKGIGEPMEIYFIAAIMVTLILAMPIIAYEVYKFIDPALNENERKLVYPFVAASSALFATGVLFGYFILAKFLIVALSPFFVATGVSPQVDSSAFYYVIFLIIGATGVSFTAPVFVYALISLRVLDADFFSRNRVMIWFAVWIVAGLFLTPDGGPLLDLVLFIPLIALLEGAVFLARRRVRGRPEVIKPINACRYCSTKLAKGAAFCPNCGRFNSVVA